MKQTAMPAPPPAAAFPLRLAPEGVLIWDEADAPQDALGRAFALSIPDGLLALAAQDEVEGEGEGAAASPAFWRMIAREYLTHLCHLPRLREDGWQGGPPPPEEVSLRGLMEKAPPEPGMEYLSVAVLQGIWRQLNDCVGRRIATAAGDVVSVLQAVHPVWRLVGRVTLHLAENKRSQDYPFTFLATYSHRIDARSQIQFLPLAQALKESAATGNRAMLQTLLAPLHAASEKSALLRGLIESREIFTALAWTPREAHAFLREVPVFEDAGLIVRIPNWWNPRRPPRPRVTLTMNSEDRKSGLGVDALMHFKVGVAMGGEALTPEELQAILSTDAPLVTLKGQWVEVDRQKLREALDHWQRAAQASADGIPFHEGMRWLAGFRMDGGALAAPADIAGTDNWLSVEAGEHLRKMLELLRDPAGLGECGEIPGLRATLRPYQKTGCSWLQFMGSLGFGACLADDMGLGKTLQVISLLLLRRAARRAGDPAAPSLLVAPASLLGNWRRELEKFAPELPYFIAHRSAAAARELQDLSPHLNMGALIITTYTMAGKLPALQETPWDVAVLDEAQAIKNAGTAQARGVKGLNARFRIALTGTPVENRLDDLWSLFDFLNPGLLGTPRRFAEAVRSMTKAAQGYAPLRQLVRPYILRRMKTDPGVAPDLPKKSEVAAFCQLSKRQGTLYQRAVQALKQELAQAEGGIQRSGVVLATLMKLKQICNHPSLWSGDAVYAPADSGKFGRLAEICQEIADRQERMLVFTQFAEMTRPLAEFLGGIFGRPGLVLHGGTPVGQRTGLVEQFQSPGGPPFFVISVKAGGAGLNLTAASHVVHFDRWWNPAVEDQATDRAYRIGQEKNVLVHKFVCQGTMEERIDELIREKRKLATDILGEEEGAARMLTEMTDDELLQFVRMDVSAVG